MSRVRVPDGVPKRTVFHKKRRFSFGDMVKLADTGDLKSPVFGLAGSSPAIPTMQCKSEPLLLCEERFQVDERNRSRIKRDLFSVKKVKTTG